MELSTVEEMETLAARIRIALNARDMTAFRSLIAEGAQWGEGGPDDERTCHNRDEIIATYKRLLAEGVRGTVTETTTGPGGVVCSLEVEWPDRSRNRRRPDDLPGVLGDQWAHYSDPGTRQPPARHRRNLKLTGRFPRATATWKHWPLACSLAGGAVPT
jgi:hypothetical protein